MKTFQIFCILLPITTYSLTAATKTLKSFRAKSNQTMKQFPSASEVSSRASGGSSYSSASGHTYGSKTTPMSIAALEYAKEYEDPYPTNSDSKDQVKDYSKHYYQSTVDHEYEHVPEEYYPTSTSPSSNKLASWGKRGGGWKHKQTSFKNFPDLAPRYTDKYLDKYEAEEDHMEESPYHSLPHYANPLLAAYPYYDRAARELATRTAALGAMSPTMATAASSLLGSMPNFGNMYPNHYRDHMASGSGDGGWGWSKEKESHEYMGNYKSGINTSGIGLLGLLGLLSLLSNVLLLLTTTTTTAAPARRKRDLEPNFAAGESDEEKRGRIFTALLPFLTPVAHVKNGQIPWECSLQGVCLTNQLLVKEYGYVGRPAGIRISSAITELIKDIGQQKGRANAKKVITFAGLNGRNHKNCQEIYPTCKALRVHESSGGVPFVIRMGDLPELLKKIKKVAATVPV